MARAKTPTNGLKIDVAASRIAVIDGALNWGVGHLLLLTTYHGQQAWSRMDGIEPPGRGDYPHLQPLHPASRKQRDEPRNDIRDYSKRCRIEHVSRLYHSRTTDNMNRSATTVMTTMTRMTKSDSAKIPPVHDVQHEQRHAVHHQLQYSTLILHSADASTRAQTRQGHCALRPS